MQARQALAVHWRHIVHTSIHGQLARQLVKPHHVSRLSTIVGSADVLNLHGAFSSCGSIQIPLRHSSLQDERQPGIQLDLHFQRCSRPEVLLRWLTNTVLKKGGG